METILQIPPRRIEYIDVINEMYIRGDNYYGGVINIVTREGDRGGLDLPGNSSIFSFKSFEPQQEIVYPDYLKNPGKERIPDVRNTLFWLPDIDVPDNLDKRIDFYTSDIPGKYMIIIRGIAEDGKVVQGQCEFIVE